MKGLGLRLGLRSRGFGAIRNASSGSGRQGSTLTELGDFEREGETSLRLRKYWVWLTTMGDVVAGLGQRSGFGRQGSALTKLGDFEREGRQA